VIACGNAKLHVAIHDDGSATRDTDVGEKCRYQARGDGPSTNGGDDWLAAVDNGVSKVAGFPPDRRPIAEVLGDFLKELEAAAMGEVRPA
jgi:hypothetical protein